jgi:hypothetical protein
MKEHVLENRLQKIIAILEKGGNYLKSEIKKQGSMTEAAIEKMQSDIITSSRDLDGLFPPSNWYVSH